MGVSAADVSLYAPDFAAAERTFELGPGSRPCGPRETGRDSADPDLYAWSITASRQRRPRIMGPFTVREMGYRRLMHYPPACHMLCMQVAGENEELLGAGSWMPLRDPCRNISGKQPRSLNRFRHRYIEFTISTEKILYMKHENYDIYQ